LMSKDKDLGLQRSRGRNGPIKAHQINLQRSLIGERVSADSRRPVSRFGFAVGTADHRCVTASCGSARPLLPQRGTPHKARRRQQRFLRHPIVFAAFACVGVSAARYAARSSSTLA
jgi:hypothetical protein